MVYDRLFWLHVKKSAGITTRALLQPYYKEVDREKKPKGFIQATQDEYNDILNNYKCLLGEYQFKRCLFAKDYLYQDRWDSMYSFAFSREPVDRCLSMFHYLYWYSRGKLGFLKNSLRCSWKTSRVHCSTSYALDVFLDCIEISRKSDSIYDPLGNHFSTHTATMWDDISDRDGKILIKKVFRLEDLTQGINQVFEECGLEKRVRTRHEKLNKNPSRKNFVPSQAQIQKIRGLYAKDIEIYESASL